jgi:methylated-DNA-[protein]-cysteine S-methyltransferase
VKTESTVKRVACRATTPLGVFTALYEDSVIHRVLFPDEPCPRNFAIFDDTLPFSAQITEYFAGKRHEFSLPMLIPGSLFRQNVYSAVVGIPYGGTASYSSVSLAAGYPLAMRAVGTAMKHNPLPLLIPCHRVVHKASKTQAYRGGLDIKGFLLDLEAHNPDV